MVRCVDAHTPLLRGGPALWAVLCPPYMRSVRDSAPAAYWAYVYWAPQQCVETANIKNVDIEEEDTSLEEWDEVWEANSVIWADDNGNNKNDVPHTFTGDQVPAHAWLEGPDWTPTGVQDN